MPYRGHALRTMKLAIIIAIVGFVIWVFKKVTSSENRTESF